MNKKFLQFLFLVFLANIINAKEEKLKILFVVDIFPASIQKEFLDQIIWFLSNGHNITILANQNNKVNTIPTLDEVIDYKLFDKVLYEYLPDNINVFDIVYCAEYRLSLRFVKLKQIKKNIFPKLITVIDGNDIVELRNSKISFDIIFKELDLVIPKSQYMAKILSEFGCDNTKIKLVNIAIDCDQYYQISKRKKIIQDVNIVTIAAYGENRLWLAIEAVGRLLNRNYNVKYTLIGRGWNEKKILYKTESGYINQNIIIKKFPSTTEINAILNSAHIFLLPSLKTDGVPFGLLQAMAKNVLVISPHQKGISELIVNEKTGFIVKYKNSTELAQILENIIRSYNKIAWNITNNARKYIEINHNYQALAKKLENIFYNLLNYTI